MMAALLAMLPACAHSPSELVRSVPDPVVVTRTVTEQVCPPELRLAMPPRPDLPADAALTGSGSGMAWLTAILARLGLLEDRIADAAKDCPA